MILKDEEFTFCGVDEELLYTGTVETWAAGISNKKHVRPDRNVEFFVVCEDGREMKVTYNPDDELKLVELAAVIVHNAGLFKFIKALVKFEIENWKFNRHKA